MTDNDRIILNQIAKNQIVIMSALIDLCADQHWLRTVSLMLTHIGETQGHLEYNEKTK